MIYFGIKSAPKHKKRADNLGRKKFLRGDNLGRADNLGRKKFLWGDTLGRNFHADNLGRADNSGLNTRELDSS